MVGFERPSGASERKRGKQRLAVMLDRPHAVLAEQHGKGLLHHLAAGEHVRHAARNAQIVFQHHEFAVGQANQIRAAHADVHVARHLHAAHLPPEMLAGVDDLARDDAVFQNPPLVINIFQEQVQRRDALRQAALDRLPFGGME